MDRKEQLRQWWEGLDDDQRAATASRGHLSPEQRDALKQRGLIAKDKKNDEPDDDDVTDLIKMRH